MAEAKRVKQRVTVTLPPQLVRRVDRLAKSSGRNRSEVVGDLVSEGIEKTEAAVKFMTNPVLNEAFSRALMAPGVMRAMSEAMAGDLTDDQLELFQSTLAKVAQEAHT